MARSSGPTTLSLPPFSGATRRLILVSLAIFFADALLGLILPNGLYHLLFGFLPLVPAQLFHGFVWQLGTYTFMPAGLGGTLFAMLALWFTAPIVESAYGPRYLYELFFTSAVGGGLLASALTFTHVRGLEPGSIALGPYAALFGILVVIGVRFGDLEFLLLFIIRIRARYLVAIYVLVDLALLLKAANPFEALLHLSAGLCGYLYLRFAPRKGLAFGASERFYGLRNEFYRSKRKRAARQFEVYMRKQNRDVRFDADGRYIDPDAAGRPPRDASDKRWMN